ncbi:MAG: LCP family protein [Paraclostridium sp.]
MNVFKKYCIILSSVVIILATITNVYSLNKYTKEFNIDLTGNNEEYINNKYSKNQQEKSVEIINSKEQEPETLVIKSNNEHITNILLIGSDAKDLKQRGRSDAMMILTIDDKNKALKLTSLARDTLVNIPGHGFEKLTHAYSYGGPKLLLETIKNNFHIEINDYISINFNSFVDLIDLLGGVEVNIEEKDIEHLNDVIANSFNISNKIAEEPQYIRISGSQLLNGYQALAYARIRKVDNIYNRDQRQRQILDSLASKLYDVHITEYPKIINGIMPYIDINMPISRILKLATKSKELYNYDIKQLEFPLDEYRKEAVLEETQAFIVKWNKIENIIKLQEFIYEK